MQVFFDRNSNWHFQAMLGLRRIAMGCIFLLLIGCAPKLRNQANLERLINALTADVTPPTILQFGAPTAPVAGGSKVQIPVLATDQVGIAKYQLSYSKDGSQFSDVSEALPDSTSISWSVPSVDLDSAVLKLTVFDYAGNKSSETSKSIRIDSTPPDAPSMTLTSSGSTNNSLVTFTADDCDDTAFLLVSESSTQPAASDSAWQSCSTTASGINHTLTADGSHSLRVWAKDEAGNISLSASSASSVFLDSTGPVLSFSTAPTILTTLKGGVSYTFNFSASDALSSVSSLKLQYAVNSSSFVDVATLATSATSYSWTVPTDNTFGAVIRLLASDSKGNASVLDTAAFTIDSTAPSVSLTSPSGTYRGGDTLNLTLSSSDAGVGLASLTLQYAADGTTFGSDISLPVNSTSYSWSIPSATNVATAKLKLIAIDNVGNSQSVTSSAFTIDSTASAVPAVSLNSSSPTNSTSATFTVSDCTDRAKIFVSEGTTTPAYNAAGWVSCSTSAGAIAFTLSSGDATKAVHFWSQDSVGNVSTTYATVNVILDTASPTLSLTSLTGGQFIPGGQNYSITWTATDANFGATPIKIEVSSNSGSSWSDIIAATTNTGSYTWAVPGSTNSTTYRIRITATDAAGNTPVTAASTSDFTIDSDAPTVSALSIVESSPTDNNSIRVNLTAADPFTNITHFCFLYNSSTQPILTDSCWVPVNNPSPGITPALNITFSNYYYMIGFTAGNYVVYGWVRDKAGNISSLSAAGVGTSGTDKAAIDYQPGAPPILSNVTSASTDTPNVPPAANDVTATVGSDVYIKWNAAGTTTPLLANPMSLYYTTDDINYTLIATNVANSANAGCNIIAGETGCYKWTGGSPSSAYFRIRVVAQNTSSSTTFAPATPMNILPPIKVIAGNTDPGLNGTARSAIFFNDMDTDRYSDTGSLLVTPSGTIYFRDIKRGILFVSPTDGVQKLLIPTTGTSTGDGGPITSATLRMPIKMSLDYDNNIIVFDYDRIRKIITSTNPMTINTIIGGGANTGDGVAPLSVQISAIAGYSASNGGAHQMPFAVLPNGDIYFMSNNYTSTPAGGMRIRVYKAASNLVQSIYLSGTGDSYLPAQNLTLCQNQEWGFMFDPTNSALTHMQTTIYHNINNANCPGTSTPGPMTVVQYDPSTGVVMTPHPTYNQTILYSASRVVGRDGNLYSTKRAIIGKYNPNTRTWAAIVGTGTIGTCADGTVATSCNIDSNDLFVSSLGQIYFMDRGLIRTVDSTNKIVTLTGQSLYYGDGGSALSARFNIVDQINTDNTGAITLFDNTEFRFRKFIPDGNIQTIAGTGENGWTTLGSPATSQPVSIQYSHDEFTVDPATGDVYYYNLLSGTYRLMKLQMSTQTWVSLAGGGATSYVSADGLAGSNIQFPSGGFAPHVIGFDGTNLLAVKSNSDTSSSFDSFMKLYNAATGTQSLFAGITGTVGTLCTNGTAMTSCRLPAAGNIDFTGGNTLYDSANSRWLLMQYNTAAIRTFTPGGNVGTLITLPSNAKSFAYRNTPSPMVYYCSASDGKLHKHNLTTDTTLVWPITSMSCAGKSLVYDSANNIITFIFIQNGMYGIAQYINP